MYCVGLTGNIGSGKTTALHYFAQLGVHIIVADHITHHIIASNPIVKESLKKHFGNRIDCNGEINRRILRTIIIQHEAERQWLESLLHPLIKKQIECEFLSLAKQLFPLSTEGQDVQKTAPYCMIEIPLLFDRNDFPYINRVLLIRSEDDLQITRLMKRDGCSIEEAKAILSIQPTTSEREKSADDMIVNHQSIAVFENAIQRLHQFYLSNSR